VAARAGLQAKSFKKAAESYSDATGGSMSSSSLRRITEGFGQALEDKRVKEAQQVYDPQTPQLAQQVVTVTAPIQEQANISTDGGMVLLREEGWKEFKMGVFSEVRIKNTPFPAQPSRTLTHGLLCCGIVIKSGYGRQTKWDSINTWKERGGR